MTFAVGSLIGHAVTVGRGLKSIWIFFGSLGRFIFTFGADKSASAHLKTFAGKNHAHHHHHSQNPLYGRHSHASPALKKRKAPSRITEESTLLATLPSPTHVPLRNPNGMLQNFVNDHVTSYHVASPDGFSLAHDPPAEVAADYSFALPAPLQVPGERGSQGMKMAGAGGGFPGSDERSPSLRALTGQEVEADDLFAEGRQNASEEEEEEEEEDDEDEEDEDEGSSEEDEEVRLGNNDDGSEEETDDEEEHSQRAGDGASAEQSEEERSSQSEDDGSEDGQSEDEESSSGLGIFANIEDEATAAERIAREALGDDEEEVDEEESEAESESDNEEAEIEEGEDELMDAADEETAGEGDETAGEGGVYDNEDSDAEIGEKSEQQIYDEELDAFANEGKLTANDDPMQNGDGEDDLPFIITFPKHAGEVLDLLWGPICRGDTKRAWKVLHRLRARYDIEMRQDGGKKGEQFARSLVFALIACMSGVMAPNAASGRKMVGALQEHVLEVFQKYRYSVLAVFSCLLQRLAVRLWPEDADELRDAHYRIKGRLAEEEAIMRGWEKEAKSMCRDLTVGGKGMGSLPGFLMPTDDVDFSAISIDDVSILHVMTLLLPVTDERHVFASPVGMMLDVLATRFAEGALLPLHVPASAKKIGMLSTSSKVPVGREWPSDNAEVDEVAVRTIAALRTYTNAARRYSPGLFMLYAKLITSMTARLGRSASSVSDDEGVATAAALISICSSAEWSLKDLTLNNGEILAIAPESAHVVCEHMIVPACIDGKRRLLYAKSDRTYPAVVKAIVSLEALATSIIRGRKVPLTLYQSRVMGIKMLDPSILDVDDSSAARRVGQKGDPNKSEHRKLKNELNQTRRSTARALRRDTEFMAQVAERERQAVDKKRIDNYKKMIATDEAEQADLRKTMTAGGHMDTSLPQNRARKDGKRGRIAGNKTDENRKGLDQKRNQRSETVRKNSRR
eukprot:GDKJ01030434.1.p1 GENE.GDKJ01030434.1~~GDKJ01030434.1.p1  ORF type:complete len:967 (-),score=292.05 GDKJ01030434.1:134-3034(-)